MNHVTSRVNDVMMHICKFLNFRPKDNYMTSEMIKDSRDTIQEAKAKIIYMEGYPLYPFFKKIYEEYQRGLIADAERLLESIKADDTVAC